MYISKPERTVIVEVTKRKPKYRSGDKVYARKAAPYWTHGLTGEVLSVKPDGISVQHDGTENRVYMVAWTLPQGYYARINKHAPKFKESAHTEREIMRTDENEDELEEAEQSNDAVRFAGAQVSMFEEVRCDESV